MWILIFSLTTGLCNEKGTGTSLRYSGFYEHEGLSEPHEVGFHYSVTDMSTFKFPDVLPAGPIPVFSWTTQKAEFAAWFLIALVIEIIISALSNRRGLQNLFP